MTGGSENGGDSSNGGGSVGSSTGETRRHTKARPKGASGASGGSGGSGGSATSSSAKRALVSILSTVGSDAGSKKKKKVGRGGRKVRTEESFQGAEGEDEGARKNRQYYFRSQDITALGKIILQNAQDMKTTVAAVVLTDTGKVRFATAVPGTGAYGESGAMLDQTMEGFAATSSMIVSRLEAGTGKTDQMSYAAVKKVAYGATKAVAATDAAADASLRRELASLGAITIGGDRFLTAATVAKLGAQLQRICPGNLAHAAEFFRRAAESYFSDLAVRLSKTAVVTNPNASSSSSSSSSGGSGANA